ncbi:MAG: hypothetical protein AAGN66_17085 [Acidobacteriota bacterium]
MARNSGTPAWIWIGCGCLLAVLLLVGVLGGLGFAGFSWLRGAVDDMADPAAREAKALEVLGAEALPEGYGVQAVFGLPWVMELVVLSDSEARPEAVGESFEERVESLENLMVRADRLGDHLFIYLKVRGRGDESLESILSGERTASGANVDLALDFRVTEELGAGDLDIAGHPVRYETRRGYLQATGGGEEGIWAAVRFECPDEIHDGLWFRRIDPPAEAPPEMDLGGTPADPAALTEFLSQFDVCR